MAGKRGDSLDDLLVSQATLASYFDVVPNTVSRLANEFGMPKHGRGQYPLGRCLVWFMRRLKDRASNLPTSLQDERRQLIAAQCEAQELENAANRAALLDSAFVHEITRELVEIVCAPLDSLPLLAVEISKLRDPAKIAALIFGECREVRRRAAADVETFAAAMADDLDA